MKLRSRGFRRRPLSGTHPTVPTVALPNRGALLGGGFVSPPETATPPRPAKTRHAERFDRPGNLPRTPPASTTLLRASFPTHAAAWHFDPQSVSHRRTPSGRRTPEAADNRPITTMNAQCRRRNGFVGGRIVGNLRCPLLPDVSPSEPFLSITEPPSSRRNGKPMAETFTPARPVVIGPERAHSDLSDHEFGPALTFP